MKKVFRNVVAACAAVALMSAFASCSSDSSDDNDAAKIVAQQQAAQKAEAEAKAKKEAEEKAAAEKKAAEEKAAAEKKAAEEKAAAEKTAEEKAAAEKKAAEEKAAAEKKAAEEKAAAEKKAAEEKAAAEKKAAEEAAAEKAKQEAAEKYGLLTGAVDLTWDGGATVEAEKLASATDNKKFVVTYTSNNDNDYHSFKMRVVSPEQELYEGVEKNITINRTSTKADELHGCSFSVAPSETAATFTYKPSAAEWAKLKTGGFNIYGHGAKITKIVLEDATEADNPPAQTPAATTTTATEVFSGSKTIDWGDNGVVIDHAKFTENFTAIRVTYNATAGAIKLAVCDPWTEITPTSVSAGTLAADGALELPTGDAQTVTINLNEAAVAGIKGQGKDGAWGGVKLYGADTITITKVESVK